MPTEAAHNAWWQTFEVVFGSPFLAAVALQILVPLAMPYGPFAPAVIALGVALVVVGAVLVARARGEFVQRGQHTDPGHPTTRLMTEGVFAISRNPLYLGGVAVLAGIALALNLPWVLVLLVPALIGCHYILIAPEERYLAAKFGEEYHRYAASVHRWIGRARHVE